VLEGRTVETKADDGMSRHEFSIAYDGEALAAADAHSIDVQLLAPALLAFGKLIREANTEFNGKKSTAKVLVVSDFEHKCFNIDFEVVLHLFEKVKSLLHIEEVKTAKEVLEWLGLLGVPTGILTYLAYLVVKRGRKVESVKPLVDADKTGVVQVTFEGDSNSVQVHNHVYNLSENPRALRATRDAFLPLGKDGFDNVKVRQGDRVVEEIDWQKVESIVKSCNVGIEEAKEPEPPEIETTPAWLSVYSPVYDLAAPLWRFRLGKEVIYADISGTNIAKDALERGGVAVEESYQVMLEITTELDAKGERKEQSYRVIEVIRFIPAGPPLRQGSLPLNGG
jgi:hypothetical protein